MVLFHWFIISCMLVNAAMSAAWDPNTDENGDDCPDEEPADAPQGGGGPVIPQDGGGPAMPQDGGGPNQFVPQKGDQIPPEDQGDDCSDPAQDGYKIVLVQIILRHGDRAPVMPYPTDPNPPSTFPEGYGKLSLKGRKMHWEMGRAMRLRYSVYVGFLTGSPNEVQLNSSAVDRCMKSGLCFAATFSLPQPPWDFQNEIPWQPTTPMSVPKPQDDWMEYGKNCPKANIARAKAIASPAMTKIVIKYRKLIKLCLKKGGFKKTEKSEPTNSDALSVLLMYDSIDVAVRWGLNVSDWVTPPIYAQMKKLNIEVMTVLFAGEHDIIKYGIGPLLDRICKNMEKKAIEQVTDLDEIKKEFGDEKDYRFIIHSAHDANIILALSALDIFDGKRPNYASGLLFELWVKDGKYFVKIVYYNSEDPTVFVGPPQDLKLKDCDMLCPLEKFRLFLVTHDIVPANYHLECPTTTCG